MMFIVTVYILLRSNINIRVKNLSFSDSDSCRWSWQAPDIINNRPFTFCWIKRISKDFHRIHHDPITHKTEARGVENCNLPIRITQMEKKNRPIIFLTDMTCPHPLKKKKQNTIPNVHRQQHDAENVHRIIYTVYEMQQPELPWSQPCH